MGLIRRVIGLLFLVLCCPHSLAAKPPVLEGKISFYGKKFQGRLTACGVRYDEKLFTMAHPTLPCGTKVVVTNLRNGRSVDVTVNDRGPHVKGRVADVSMAAAKQLRMVRSGVVRGRLQLPGSFERN